MTVVHGNFTSAAREMFAEERVDVGAIRRQRDALLDRVLELEITVRTQHAENARLRRKVEDARRAVELLSMTLGGES